MSQSSQPFTLKQTLIVTGGILLGLCIIITLLYERLAFESAREEFRARISSQSAARHEDMLAYIDKQRQRIRFIHTTPPVQGLVRAEANGGIDPYDNTKSAQWVTRLQTIFEAYIENNPDITQMRYIGIANNGRELVRVERRGTNIKRVEGTKLQEKGQSDYFKEISLYPPQHVYISNITLNREYGRIQVPHAPTQRIAMPVYDDFNEIFGMVIINVDATEQITHSTANLSEQFQLYILNAEGGFIVHPDKNFAFEFEFEFEFEFNDTSKWMNEFKETTHPTSSEDYFIAQDIKRGSVLYYLSRTILLSDHQEGRYLTLNIGVTEDTIEQLANEQRNGVIKILGGLIAVVFALFSFYQVNLFNRIGLMRDQAEYEAIISGSSDGILAMTESGIITNWNSAAETITGYTSRMAIGQNILELLFKNSSSNTVSSAIQKAYNGQTGSSLEAHATTSTGKLIDLAISLSAITLDNGNAAGVAAIIRDVTDQKLLDKKILDLNITLEKKVEERTKELEFAKNQALEANKTKSEFIANVSHEIRTPMNGVLGMLRLLRNDPLTQKQEHHLNMATLSAKNLTRLINDILDMSKIEAGKLDIDESEFNLLQMLADASSSLAVRAQTKNLEFIIDSAKVQHEWVVGDALRLNQIITNLVGNALKFTDQGEIVIHAQTEAQDNDHLVLRCFVQDSGKGIAKDKLSQLFDSFTQEDSSITKHFGGTGLGLTICRQLCHLMKGNISVTSTEGKGSKFTFEVSLKTSNHVKTNICNANMDGKQVLFVSPNEKLRDALGNQLEAWNCTVTDDIDIQECLNTINEADESSTYLFDCNIQENFLEQLAKRKDSTKASLFLLQSTGKDLASKYGLSAINKPVTSIALYRALKRTDGTEKAEDASLAHSDSAPSTSSSVLKEARILLVDDNDINLEVGTGLLEDFGINVTTANSGQACIDLVASTTPPFHVILMDCQMPGMDGYATTNNIRNGASGSDNINTIIIAMTAHAMSGARETCVEAGMNDYLPKPIDPDTLEAKLIKWISSQRPTEAAQDNIESTSESISALTPAPAPTAVPTPAPTPTTQEATPEDNAHNDTAQAQQQEPQKHKEIWDREDALNRVRGKPQRLNKLIEMFMSSMPERVDNLERAVHEMDFTAVSALAHEIKGVTGNLSCIQLAKYAAELESNAEILSPSELAELLLDTLCSYKKTSEMLQEYIDSL